MGRRLFQPTLPLSALLCFSLPNVLNALNATELYTLKMIKMVNLDYAYLSQKFTNSM